jgi:hypothetical protein
MTESGPKKIVAKVASAPSVLRPTSFSTTRATELNKGPNT